mgnify:CR=1 FL=1
MVRDHTLSEEMLEQNARMLEGVLEDFGVKGEIIHVRPGPVVTLYELEPAPGIKSSRVIGLADDIARSMSAIAARVAVVPGRNAIGIELPNQTRETVYLRELIGSRDFDGNKAKLAMALGKPHVIGSALVTEGGRHRRVHREMALVGKGQLQLRQSILLAVLLAAGCTRVAQHALGFAGLTFLGVLAYARWPLRVLAGLALLGLCIEVAQSLTGWRHGDGWDWLADLVGLKAYWGKWDAANLRVMLPGALILRPLRSA